jgi:hypothetical protein
VAAASASAVQASPSERPAVADREARRASPARSRSRVPWILGVIVVVAGATGAVVIASHSDTPLAVAPLPPAVAPPTPAAVPAEPQATPDPSAAAAAPTARTAAQPTTVTLRFAVEPAGAAITVDGARVTGTELAVPRDDAVHTLRITAPGHTAHDEAIRFDESQRLVVQLKRSTGPTRNTERRKPRSDTDRIDSESPY